MNRRAGLLLAAVLASGTAASAAIPYGTVAGRVEDGDAVSLGGARVTLVEGSTGARRSAVSDIGGRFDLRRVWPGDYRLEVDAAGHQWVEVRELTVAPGRTVVLAIRTRVTTADEIVLLTGSPTVDAAASELAVPAAPEAARRLPGDRWTTPIPLVGPDASDGARSGDRSWLGAPSVELSRTLDGGPPPPGIRDLAPARAPADPARTAVIGGLGATGADRLGAVSVAVMKSPRAGRGRLAVELGDESLAGADRGTPVGRAGRTTPAAAGRVELIHGGALVGDALWGFAALAAGEERQRIRARPGGGAGVTDDLVDVRFVDWAASLDWLGPSWHRVRASATGRRSRDRGVLSTVDRVDGAVNGLVDGPTDTRFDADLETWSANVSWLGVPSERIQLDAQIGHARAAASFDPASGLPAVVDATSAGVLSGGLGGGVVLGGAGFAPHRDEQRSTTARLGFSLDLHRDHRFEGALELAVHRARRDPSDGAGADRGCVGLSAAVDLSVIDCDSDGDGVDDGLGFDRAAGTRIVALDEGWWIVDSPETAFGGRGEEWTVHLVERWRPGPEWTVSAGLRAGRWTAETTGGAVVGGRRVVSFDPSETVGGFLGGVWDFEGRGRSRVYAQVGRWRRPLSLDPDAGQLVRSDPLVVRVAGTPSPVGLGGHEAVDLIRPAPLVVGPSLEPGRVDDAIVGVEYEVLAGLLVGAAATVRSMDRDPTAVTLDGGRSWFLTSRGGVVHEDPGTGVALDEPAALVAPRRDLEAAMLYGRRRWAAGWQTSFWIAWSRLEGTIEGATVAGLRRFDRPVLGHPLTPASGDVAGPLANDRRWQGRLSGAARLGAGLTLGGTVGYASGAPRSRLGRLDPPLGLDQRVIGGRGDAGRTPALWRLDVRLEWSPVERFEVWVDVLNLLDDQSAVAADPRWTVAGPDAVAAVAESRWGEPSIRQPSRAVTVGTRWSW